MWDLQTDVKYMHDRNEQGNGRTREKPGVKPDMDAKGQNQTWWWWGFGGKAAVYYYYWESAAVKSLIIEKMNLKMDEAALLYRTQVLKTGLRVFLYYKCLVFLHWEFFMYRKSSVKYGRTENTCDPLPHCALQNLFAISQVNEQNF